MSAYLSTVIAVAMMAAIPHAAFAEDWSGSYVGGNIGGGRGDVDLRFRPLPGGSSDPQADHDSVGLIGGFQAGYNWQNGSWVTGAELSVSAGAIRGSDRCPGRSWSCESDVQWLGSARGRVGYSFPSVLLYATGGVGFSRLEFASDNGSDRGEIHNNHIGWVVGLGAEYAVNPAWSVRAEYLHYDFNRRPYSNSSDIIVDTGFRLDTLTLGINRRF